MSNKIKLDEASDEFKKLSEEWKIECDKINTLKELNIFLTHLINDYEHDYGTIGKSIYYGMKATFKFMNRQDQGHITGFQAECLGWILAYDFLMLDKDYRYQLKKIGKFTDKKGI